MRKLLILNIFVAAVLMSCDEPYEITTKQAPPRVVIDGLLTDNSNYQFVKLNWSTDFYTPGKGPVITDATVSVTDDAGNVFNYVHNPRNQADSAGIYIPESSFAGIIGRTYTLKVIVNNQTYEASDKMTDVTPIDSVTTKIDEDEKEDPEYAGRFYEILIFTKEPQNEQNFYLFKFFRNDSLLYANDTDIYYSDDELLAENIEGVEGPLYYSKGDKAKIEAFSMTRQGYVYYNDLSSLLNGDSGGMFGPIPSSPRTNVTNGALGFFQVGAVKQGEIIVE